jgi:hypothetical protein
MTHFYRAVLRRVDLTIGIAICILLVIQFLLMAWCDQWIPLFWITVPSVSIYVIVSVWLLCTSLRVMQHTSVMVDRATRGLLIFGFLTLGYFQTEWMISTTPTSILLSKRCTLTTAAFIIGGFLFVTFWMHRKAVPSAYSFGSLPEAAPSSAAYLSDDVFTSTDGVGAFAIEDADGLPTIAN